MNAMQEKQDNVVVVELAQDVIQPGLEIQLKAERVQEPASLQAKEAEAFLYGLSVQPVQPVSIALNGTSAVVTLHGPGGAGPGESEEARHG